MTLDEALAFARAHQPAIRSALARFRARQQEARVPRAQWMPQVGATAQAFYGTVNTTTAQYLNVPEVDILRIGSTRVQTGQSLSPYGSTLVGASLTQEVFDFGRFAAQAAAADALVDAARADTDAVALDVEVGVEEAFAAVLAAQQVLVAARDAEKRATAHRDLADAGVKSGTRPPIELTRAGADLALATLRRLRAEAGLVAARAGLASTLAADELEVDAQPPATPEEARSPSLHDAIELARSRNPALVSALASIRAGHEARRAIGRELLPNLFASVGVNGRAGGAPASGVDPPTGAGWLPYVVNWHAGVVLQWNLFDATVLARRDTARAREEQLRADYDTARTATVLAVQRAWIDEQGALTAIPALVQAVAAAQANQQQADARFRGGLGTAVELADAEALLTAAEVELAVGRFTVDRARARLARAIGLPAAGTITESAGPPGSGAGGAGARP